MRKTTVEKEGTDRYIGSKVRKNGRKERMKERKKASIIQDSIQLFWFPYEMHKIDIRRG